MNALAYGNRSIDLPLAWQALPELNPPATSLDGEVDRVEAYILRTLDRRMGATPLAQRLSPTDRVTVIVSDRTRPTGAERFLPPLLLEIASAGVRLDHITLLFSLGIHRHQSEEERTQVLGPSLPKTIRIIEHDAYDATGLVDLGTTSRGTPVRLNRHAVEADLRIVTGTIGLHYFAGFSGGRKGLFPGVASADGIAANHLLVLNPNGRGRDPRVRTGVLEGNPVHEDMEEAALRAGPSFLFNTVLSPSKGLLATYAGDLQKAFRQGCDFCRRAYTVPIDHPFDAAVVSCGGHPRDIDFIQSHKTLEYATAAVKEGGTIVLLAACTDGLGSDHFAKWFQHPDLASMERALRAKYEVYGQTAWATRAKAERFRIFLCSELPDDLVRTMGMTPIHDLGQIDLPPDSVVIPHGASTLASPAAR